MTQALDETHDASARSWVESAARSDTDFPVQNLPFGLFRHPARGRAPRLGVAIGDQILDLAQAVSIGLLDSLPAEIRAAAVARSLNPLMALGRSAARSLRGRLFGLLVGESERAAVASCLAPLSSAELVLPVEVGDYTDFYASVHHATNVGSMFRPDSPLLPNYKYVPIGYHGRASSIVVSGAPVRRPCGQTRDDPKVAPAFGPSRSLDYECEVGGYIAGGNPLGTPISLAEAERHLFGICLLNDWSARDIQRWEYQPLGPFLAKSFATTVSPWVVTLDALAPFRVPAYQRPPEDPDPLPHLAWPQDREAGGMDVTVEVHLATERMRREGLPSVRLSVGSLALMYWTMAQLVAHHTSNGCNLRPGDLLGSGTISGPTRESRGCLLELTWGGTEPIVLPTGETRRYLEDGDEIIMRGHCERDGFVRIGLGECRAVIVPA